ncbi:hypothetical protein HYDPIDRAFT_32221 [Hydnomerulius pinastri MD-312]|uniref:Unplaced genomic scaffold scaffold_38, whole genome shotgun sequence n=1 Tax=Hydnomerulius pinastri MD-312 TaxID=994086 RepID=A0A0C9WAC7_9AGAM|nr:hypothetical protein HYDPIDRAFT_32221 [Hydnomerulius pinastri MD-312]
MSSHPKPHLCQSSSTPLSEQECEDQYLDSFQLKMYRIKDTRSVVYHPQLLTMIYQKLVTIKDIEEITARKLTPPYDEGGEEEEDKEAEVEEDKEAEEDKEVEKDKEVEQEEPQHRSKAIIPVQGVHYSNILTEHPPKKTPHGGEDVTADDDPTHPHVSGCLSQAAYMKVQELGRCTVEEVEAIAKEFNKSRCSIMIAAGLMTKASHSRSDWNMYQSWYAHTYPKAKDNSLSTVCQVWDHVENIVIAGVVLYMGVSEASHHAAGIFSGSELLTNLIEEKKYDIKLLMDYLTTVVKSNFNPKAISACMLEAYTYPALKAHMGKDFKLKQANLAKKTKLKKIKIEIPIPTIKFEIVPWTAKHTSWVTNNDPRVVDIPLVVDVKGQILWVLQESVKFRQDMMIADEDPSANTMSNPHLISQGTAVRTSTNPHPHRQPCTSLPSSLSLPSTPEPLASSPLPPSSHFPSPIHPPMHTLHQLFILVPAMVIISRTPKSNSGPTPTPIPLSAPRAPILGDSVQLQTLFLIGSNPFVLSITF